MTVLVKYFGSIAEKTGLPSEVVEIDSNTDSQLLEESIRNKYHLSDHNYKIALNLEILKSSKPLKDRDEIAFLPPFAGG